jgi:hypothetical protein
MKGWENIYQANGSPKQKEVGILISDKVHHKHKLVRRHKEGNVIFIKGAKHQEKTTTINCYVAQI